MSSTTVIAYSTPINQPIHNSGLGDSMNATTFGGVRSKSIQRADMAIRAHPRTTSHAAQPLLGLRLPRASLLDLAANTPYSDMMGTPM